MARQRLPKSHRRHPYTIASLGMDRRPELTSLIGQCLMHWSNIELQMALLLGVLLDATNEAAVAVYLSLRAGRVRQGAINAAANTVLNGDALELYRAITAFQRSIETERNDLAHGCFGVMESITDGALWMELQHVANFMLDFWNKVEHSTPAGPKMPTSTQDRDQIYSQNLDRMFVYRERDIKALLRDIEALWRDLGSFIYYLRNSKPKEIYDGICAEPHIKAELKKNELRDRSGRRCFPPV